MEKRLLVAALLSLGILFLWQVIFPPPKRVAPVPAAAPATASPAAAASVAAPAAVAGVPATAAPAATTAATAPVAKEIADRSILGVADETVVLENPIVRVVLVSTGARIRSMTLTGYRTDDAQPVDLVAPDGPAPLALELGDKDANDFAASAVYRTERTGPDAVTFEAAKGPLRIVRTYRLRPDGALDFTAEAEGRAAGVTVGPGVWPGSRKERERRLTQGEHALVVGRGDDVDRTKEGEFEQPVAVAPGADFVALDEPYFLVALCAMPTASFSAEAVVVGDGKKGPQRDLRLSAKGAEPKLAGRFVFAPKEVDRLESYGVGLENGVRFVTFGKIFEPLARGLLIALRWFHSFAQNWGIAIILLTIAVRVVLFGFTWKSSLTMKRMQALSPQVEEIKERYRKKKADPESRQKMNQEVMELYQKAGVNPAAGCLPLLLQLPIFFALFGLLGHAIELRHSSFLWMGDLSVKDPYYVMPILMGVAWFVQTLVTPSTADPLQRKIFLAMPIVFTATMLNFAAGLTLYWAVSNTLSILQQWLINRKS